MGEETKALLEQWEKRAGLTPTEAAAKLGMSFGMYRAVKHGERRPRLSKMLDFQETTGVAASLVYPELEGLI